MIKNVFMVMLAVWPLFAHPGEAIYVQHCAACHQRYVDKEILAKNFMEMNNTLLDLKAPTVNQLAFRLKQRIGDPEGDREFHLMEVVEFVKDYVFFPDKQKSVCLPEVIRNFDTMPSMKGEISEEELETVTEWIYYSDIPTEGGE